MADRIKETCDTCDGAGRVVDERQAGEPVATCMACKGNGWVYTDNKPVKLNDGWLRASRPATE
jgi:DnaJ-class molecular chaperone